MFTHLRWGTQHHTTASHSGRRLRRLAAVLITGTVGLLAWAAAVPAAFASDVPPGSYGRFPGRPVSPATGHAATAGGAAGWQIALIAAIALGAIAVVTVLVDRTLTARRTAPARRAAPARTA